MDQRRDQLVVQIYRAASRLRNLLLSLPIGIEAYEQALLASGQSENLWHDWSVTRPLQALRSRLPEMAALGDWEELILQELVGGFQRLADLFRRESPKREPLLVAIGDSLSNARRVSLVVTSYAVAGGLKWVICLPPPHGLGLSSDRVTAITVNEISMLHHDQDCIIHEVFDPHAIFSALARAGPRKISFILMRNELRFVGEQLLRTRRLFPQHPANDTMLQPLYQQMEHLEPTSRLSRRDRTATLFSDSDFAMVMRMFNQGPRMIEHATVLIDESEHPESSMLTEVSAYLVQLEGGSAVFLDVSGQLSYVQADDTIITGPVDTLEPGHRLIVVNPAARESIMHRILAAKRGEETDQLPAQIVEQWRRELSQGIGRHNLTYNEALHRIRELGSEKLSADGIGQWVRGDVLGPLDARDIVRIGEVVESTWLIQNWQRVGLALAMVRSGHRLLGRQITRIIQSAALGDYELARPDEEFLQQIGIRMGELQDAVTLLTIEAISRDGRVVPVDQIGKVIPV